MSRAVAAVTPAPRLSHSHPEHGRGGRRAVTSGGAWVTLWVALSQHCAASSLFLALTGAVRCHGSKTGIAALLADRTSGPWEAAGTAGCWVPEFSRFCSLCPLQTLWVLSARVGVGKCWSSRACSSCPIPAPQGPALFLTVLSPAGCQTGEEGRSVGCARRPCTSLRRCSVKATASTSPASCAVSTTPSLPGQGLLRISTPQAGAQNLPGHMGCPSCRADLSWHRHKDLVHPCSKERPGWVLWSVSRC